MLPAGLLTGPGHRPGVLLAGGEPVGEPLWRQLAAAPGTACYNLYGPTECTVDALACPVAGSDRPSLGRPLPNVRVYVLDGALGPVPAGVPGELYLAGGAGGPRVPEPAGADRAAVRGVPVRAARRADVPDR